MVRAHDIRENLRLHDVWHQGLVHEGVIQAPTHVAGTRSSAVAPPGKEMMPDVYDEFVRIVPRDGGIRVKELTR